MVYRLILSRDLSDLLQGRRMERMILHQGRLMQICVNEGSQIPLKLPVSFMILIASSDVAHEVSSSST